MAAEITFIDVLAAHLSAQAGLAGATIGAADPAVAADLPAVVLSLTEVHRLGAGLGERAALVSDGALAVNPRIDLANPVLAGEPSLRLLSADRLTLVMPHGGWVKADASAGLLSSADLQVSVAGVPRTVVNAAPAPGEVQPDAAVGTLRFGAPLPAAGEVQVRYFLGQWERRVTPIAGALRIDVFAAAAATALTLSQAVVDALDAGAGVLLPAGLRKITLGAVSSVGGPAPLLANARGRSLAFAFEYDHQIDRPDSSGGVIRRIPIDSRLVAMSVEPASGALITTVITEVSEVPP